MGQPRPLFHLFSSFQTNITIFTPNKCEKGPSSTRCWDSNPQPLINESPPITTKPYTLRTNSIFQFFSHYYIYTITPKLTLSHVLTYVCVPISCVYGCTYLYVAQLFYIFAQFHFGSWCYKTFYGENLDFPNIKKFHKVCYDV